MRFFSKSLIALFGFAWGVLFMIPIISFAQDYFQASGIPVQRSAVSSAEFRTEFASIETNLSDKLPALAGNGNNFVVVNAGATGLVSLSAVATAAALGTPLLVGNETITGAWTFEADVDLDNGVSLFLFDSTDMDSAEFSHDGTDFNLAFTNTTDWNMTGITVLAAGTVDADFDAITATSYGAIVEGNLVDKSAAETIAGAWTLPEASITGHEAAIDHDALTNFAANEHLNWTADLGGTNLHANNAANAVLALTSAEVIQLANIGATAVTADDWTAVAALVGTNTGDQTITLTGDVTGAGTGTFAATVQPSAISGQSLVTAVATDMVVLWDATDSMLKRADVGDFLGAATTHTLTGDVTGSGSGSFAATIQASAISGQSLVTAIATDMVMLWDATDSMLKRANVGDFISAGATELNALTDVVLTSPVTGAFLRYNASEFIDVVLVAGDIPNLDTAKTTSGIFAAARVATHTGDVTGQAALTIAADAVTYAKMQNVVADNRILGNISGAGGIVAELTAANVLTLINVEAGSTADQTSIVGITGTGAQFNTANTDGNFAFSAGAFHDGFSDFVGNEHLNWLNDLGGSNIHANNSINGALALTSGEVTQLANIGGVSISGADWTAVAALVGTNTGDQTITLTGNVTGSGTGSFAATIAADAVTLDRMLDIGTDTFLGRTTAGTGTVEILTATQSRAVLNIENGSTADQTSIVGITGTTAQFNTANTDGNFAILGATANFGALTATTHGGITEANLLDKAAVETVTGAWTFEADVDLDNGVSLFLFDSSDADSAEFSHDGTDFNTVFLQTTDWNISGITVLNITGAIVASGDITAFSDLRLKEDLKVIDNALDKVGQLNGYTYTLLSDGARHAGVVAQEVESVLPEVVRDYGEYKTVALGNMIALLIESIKELNSKVEALH